MSTITREVQELVLPFGEYAVVGSGALSVRDIRPHNDIDLIVTEDLYAELVRKGWEEKEKMPGFYHIYSGNAEAAKNFLHIPGCVLTTEGVIRNADVIDGVPFMSLTDLLELKQVMGREKDLKDIEALKRYMDEHATT